MEELKMNGLNKASIVLMALGEDFASKVFQKMSDNEISALVSSMNEIDFVPAEKLEIALHDFNDLMKQYDKELMINGAAYARRLISSSRNDKGVEKIIQKIDEEKKNIPFENLKGLNAKLIADFIKGEHPQTIALIIAHLETKQAAEILENLEELIQCQVVMRLAELDTVPNEVIMDVDKTLKNELLPDGSMGSKMIGGIKKIAKIMNYMEQAVEYNIMTRIEEEDRRISDKIKHFMFEFEDIINIDNRGIQLIIKEINHDDLVISLKTASDGLINKIYSNMSEGAAIILKEDLESLGPVRLSDVERLQYSIIQTIRRLEDEGVIATGIKKTNQIIL